MIHQEAFDKAFLGVYKQGKPSIRDKVIEPDESSACLYYANGLRCGIGHIFPPELYSPTLENMAVGYLIYRWNYDDEAVLCDTPIARWFQQEFNLPPKLPTFSGHPTLSLLCAIQRAHDNAASASEAFLSTFCALMRQVAKNHKLSAAVIDQSMKTLAT